MVAVAGPRMYESWDGPSTTDPRVIRKRRLFLVALVVVFGALAAAAFWLWHVPFWYILAVLAAFAVLGGIVEAFVQWNRLKRD
ncbi:MAG: hypothetical protein QOJ26_965 [Thermoplasmata archaeon]|nr:hypothetical protein [Thermoplasmata archaeon]